MRRSSLLALAGLLGGLVAVVPSTAASAEDVYERPADGTFEVQGHGWGHGRGMSQWGAQGAASQGRTADEITSTYYPGTQRMVLADSSIRVWLSADEGRDTDVFAAPGLTVTDGASGTTLTLPDGPVRWRAVVSGAGLQLQSLTGSTWTAYPLGGRTELAGPVRFGGPEFVRVQFPVGYSRDYRGSVQAVRSGSGLKTVDVLSLEDYLLGVVPREASASWRPAALQAQAIAARSYSAAKRSRAAAGAAYDICDTTACQVFAGSRLYSTRGTATELEPASSTDAVHATRGVVRALDGKALSTEFSSSNGGWSTSGGVSYLVAREDPWDGALDNPVHSWTASLPVSALEKRFPALGTLTRLRITQRDGNGEWGGRVRSVVLEGVKDGRATSVTTTGSGVYGARTWPAFSDGLRSTWFRLSGGSGGGSAPAPSPSPTDTPTTGSAVRDQSTAPTLVRPPGVAQRTATVALTNTGSTAWPVADLHLAVAGPAGAADPLAGGSTRPGTFVANRTRPGATSVAPGEVAELSVAFDASGVGPGRYVQAYRARLGTGPLFGATVTWAVVVEEARMLAATASAAQALPGTTAQSTRADAPGPVLTDGRTVVVPRNGSATVRLSARNTGNVAWPAGSNGPVLLGTAGPHDRASASYGTGWPTATRAARLGGNAAVRPASVGTFDLTLNGGGRPVGVSTEQFEPLWAGRTWMAGAIGLNVIRVDPAVSRLATVHSYPQATTLAKGAVTTLVVRLRNLGGSPWTVGKELVQAAAAEPLRTSAWLSATRPPALAANASRPGVTAVYPGEIGEWRIPLTGRTAGTFRTTLRAVAPSGVAYGPALTTTTRVTS